MNEITREKLSFVIPVYNSRDTVSQVVKRIGETVLAMENEFTYEVILVNDGSKDESFEVCKRLCSDKSVIALNLSKNFGQANAIMAGLKQASGDYIICLDDDLQTPPEEMPKILNKLLLDDLDLVYGYYGSKKHSLFRNFGSFVNSKMQTMMLGKPKGMHTSSYFVARRFVVDEVVKYDKPFPYMPGLFLRVTRNAACVEVRHDAREVGKSGYTIKKLLSLWMNGFTNFSIKPLRWATTIGALFSFIGLVLGVWMAVHAIISPIEVASWGVTIAIVLFLGGVQLISIGLLGEYVGRVYLSINKTPQYVVKERVDGTVKEQED